MKDGGRKKREVIGERRNRRRSEGMEKKQHTVGR